MIRQRRASEIKKIKLYKMLCYVLSIIIMLFSVGVWIVKYIDFEPFALVSYLQTFYIMMIGFFILISGNKLLSQLLKSFIKLFFSVWIMAFILISTLSQLDQNIYFIYVTFIIGYFEVLIEINEIIKEFINNLNLEKYRLEFTKNEVLTIMSIPLTVIFVSVLHIILAMTVRNSFNKLLI